MLVMKEFECEDCGQRVIELRGGPDNRRLIINEAASPAGHIIIKGNRATILRSAERAKKFLELAGAEAADRHIVHACWAKPKPKKRRR